MLESYLEQRLLEIFASIYAWACIFLTFPITGFALNLTEDPVLGATSGNRVFFISNNNVVVEFAAISKDYKNWSKFENR